MWTQFWDMHSGGDLKEKWAMIYIEAPKEEAEIIFYNRFGHNPHRVTCTCCGGDYSISTKEDLSQLTGYHRHCRVLETPRDPQTGLCKNDDPTIRKHSYLEADEAIPKGYKLSELGSWKYGEYQTLEEYKENKDVLVISAKDIKPEERVGEVPDQGYVWV